MKELDKQRLPKWFDGELYDEGATVQNRFSGEKYELNNVELSMYDFVMGATICMEVGMPCNVSELRKGLDWFRKNNSEAYMVLLDYMRLMTDITKCDGKECTMKETCWRYKAPKDYYQSYFTESPHNNKVDEANNTICEYYWKQDKLSGEKNRGINLK